MKGFGNLFKAKKPPSTTKKEEQITVSPKELTDEIREFRNKKVAFDATNEHNTYCIVVFSCTKDKEIFLKGANITAHTVVDGYELASNLNLEPKLPSVKLPQPLGE